MVGSSAGGVSDALGHVKDNPASVPALAARARVNNNLNDVTAFMMKPHQGVGVSNDLDEYTR